MFRFQIMDFSDYFSSQIPPCEASNQKLLLFKASFLRNIQRLHSVRNAEIYQFSVKKRFSVVHFQLPQFLYPFIQLDGQSTFPPLEPIKLVQTEESIGLSGCFVVEFLRGTSFAESDYMHQKEQRFQL